MRNYKRKTQRSVVTEEQIEEALTDVRLNKLTVKEASMKHGLPYSSLMCRRKRAMDAMGAEWEDPTVPINMGLKTRDRFSKHSSRQVFSCEQEDQLADYIIKCSRMSHGLTINDTQKFAYYHAVRWHGNIPGSWERDKKAGKDWARGFMKRHRISFDTSGAINEELDLGAPTGSPELPFEGNLEDNDGTNMYFDYDDRPTLEMKPLDIVDELNEVEKPAPLHLCPELIPLDLTVRFKFNRNEVQISRKRPQSMIEGPQDLSKPSISTVSCDFGEKGRAEHEEIKKEQITKEKIKQEPESEGESQEGD